MNSRSLLLGGALVLLMHNAAAFDFNKLINKLKIGLIKHNAFTKHLKFKCIDKDYPTHCLKDDN